MAASNLSRLPGPEYRPTDQLHLRSAKKMRRLFADHPAALTNAAAMAERCAGAVDLSGKVHIPVSGPRGYVGAEDPQGEGVRGGEETLR